MSAKKSAKSAILKHDHYSLSLVSRLILKMFFEIFENQLFIGHFLA